MKPAEQHEDLKKASFDEPGKFRKYTSLSAMKASESSLRTLFSLSKPDKAAMSNGPSMREVGAQYYLREEIRAAREAVTTLDAAVSGAQSFREKATKLLEEAHRALGRLEQAVAYRDGAPELIVIACEIKCAARRGITLVDVYGKYSTMVKVMTLFMRSFIHSKFDKQVEHLKSLIPPAEVMRGAADGLGSPPGPPAAPGVAQLASPPTGKAAAAAATGALPPSTTGPIPITAMAPQPQPQPPMQAAASQGLSRSSTSQQPGAVPQPHLTAPHLPSGPLVGTLLRPNKHDRVHAMAYVPAAQAPGEHVCIWWSAGQALEFYSEATQSTTGFTIEKPSLNVTALGIDEDGNVWTGHAKGLVRVRPKQQWEYMVEDKAFSSAVKAITFDQAGRAWIGDDGGRIKVLGYDPRAGRLESVASLQRSPALLAKMKGALADTTRGLFGKRHCGSTTSGQASAAVAFAAASAAAAAATQPVTAVLATGAAPAAGASSGGAGGSPPVAIEGPVRCIFLRGGRAWTSGGRSTGWLQLWDATSFQDLDVYDCCGFGPCHAMTALRWPSGPSSTAPALPSSAPHHRPTQSDGSRPHPAASASSPGSWRLLTGHENGQLLLWHPDHNMLAPLLRIGEPCSPCRGIAAFEPFHLIATGHQNGELHLFVQPTAESGLPPGSNSASPMSFGTLRPRTVTVQAHKSRVDRMSHSATSCVTGSMLGTIRLWHAADLAAEAHRQGLLAHASSYGSLQALACASVGGAGGAGAGGGMSSVTSLQPLGSRYTASSSLGDLSLTPHQYAAVSQFQHDSVHRLGSVSEQLSQGTTATTAGQGGTSTSGGSAAPAMPNTLSAALSRVSAQLQQLSGAGPHHVRHGSKDSVDAGGVTGSLTQQSSGNTTTAELGPALASQAQPLPSQAAAFPHFQTIDSSELSMKKMIGSGAYGKVWMAEWTGCQVAVKELFGLQGGLATDAKEYVALMNEVTLLGSLSHPNIMRFLAMSVDPPLIVMQYYPHGSLFDLLHRAQRGNPKAAKELSWSKRLDMLRDVAAGMQYLHSRKPPVIHGDLRSPNLLLDLTIDRDRPRFHVKIADFGLARMATGATGSVMVSKTTNPRWLAPEVIRNSSVGKAADVYSFAIIMWEMLTWQQPFEDMMSVQVMFSTVTENSRPEVPPDSELPGAPGVSLRPYLHLMERCWHPDASQRPSFKEVVEHFQSMQQSEAESAKQHRQHPQGASTPPPPSGRRSRGSSDTGQPTPAYGAGAGTSAGAGETANVSAPGSSGSSGNGPTTAVAAVGAGARRTAGPSVVSPFSGAAASVVAAAVVAEEASGAGGAAVLLPATAGQQQQQQYGSILPLYGMSPILEEQISSGNAHPSGAVAAASAGPVGDGNLRPPAGAAPHVAANGPIPAAVASPSQVLHGSAAVQPAQHPSSPFSAPQQQQQQQQYGTHPHVHFAPSPFAGAEVAAQPCSSPSSPLIATRHQRNGSGGAARTCPPSSASSTESGALHPVSGGSNLTGASTGPSSRHSSTSTSGRTVAAAVTAAAAAVAAAAASGGAGAARRVGSSAIPAATLPSRADGSGSSTPRGGAHCGTSASGGVPTSTAARAAARRLLSGAPVIAGSTYASSSEETAAAGSPSPPVWETQSVPSGGITALSPFACMPPAQLHELGASAPHGTATALRPPVMTVSAPAPPFAGSSPFSAASQAHGDPASKHHGAAASSATRPAGPSAAGSAPASRAGSSRPGVSNMSHAASATTNLRGRMPGPCFGPGPPSRAAPAPAHGTTARAAGTSGNASQPGTPPHRGLTGSALNRSTGGAGVASSAVPEYHRAPSGRPGSGTATRHTHSGDAPESTGSRTSTMVSRTPSVSSASPATAAAAAAATSGASAYNTPHSIGGGELPGSHTESPASQPRQTHSAAQSHVTLTTQDAPGSAGKPGHRRTPSGGNSPGISHGSAGAGVFARRSREPVVASTTAVSVTSHHREIPSPATCTTGPSTQSRTPAAAARSGRTSPLASGPVGATEPRSIPRDVRRTTAAAAGPSGTAAATTGTSPTAPSSGYLSRLGAAASGRPPASPRTCARGGPGTSSAHGGVSGGASGASGGGTSLTTGGGVPLPSRIPSLAHGVAPGASPPPPVRTATSRSLDDANLRRLGLCNAASGSSPVASVDHSPATSKCLGASAAGGTASPFAMAAWEDGLGVHLSPEATADLPECCFRTSGDYSHVRQEGEMSTQEDVTRGPSMQNRSSGLPRNVVAEQGAELIASSQQGPGLSAGPVAAAAAWQPPPLLTNRAAGSPFAAAAFSSPFAAAAAASTGDAMNGHEGLRGSVDELGQSDDVTEARTSPIAPSTLRAESALAGTSASPTSWGAGGFGSYAPLDTVSGSEVGHGNGAGAAMSASPHAPREGWPEAGGAGERAAARPQTASPFSYQAGLQHVAASPARLQSPFAQQQTGVQHVPPLPARLQSPFAQQQADDDRSW